MDGLDVDGFISSQRAKLTEEKSQLQRRGNGILPSDSFAMEKSEKLRRERQSEYQEYMKNDGVDHSQKGSNREKIVPSGGPPSNKSVTEIRQVMSREREREIHRNRAALGPNKDWEKETHRNQDWERETHRNRAALAPNKDWERETRAALAPNKDWERETHRNRASGPNKDWEQVRGNNYASLRERKLAEERQYRGNTHNQEFGRNGGESYSEHSGARFRGEKPTHGSSWDEEETELLKWTQNQASNHRSHTRAQTPPIVDSPRVKRSTSKSSLRSISAPSVAPPLTGIAGLGKYEDSRVKRLRQLKYAEELRSQMKEKQSKPHATTAWRAQPDTGPSEGGKNRQVTPRSQQLRFSDDHDFPPPGDHPGYDGGEYDSGSHDDRRHSGPPRPPHHWQYESGDEEKRRSHKNPPRGYQNGSGERNGYHQNPYGPPPPPPPPPRFQGYGGWGGSYYPYPPHGPGYNTDPYMYYPQPRYPNGGNRYCSPPREPRSSSRFYGSDEGRERESSSKEENRVRRHRSDKEPEVSPLLGAAENRPKSDKAAYRKELERQIEEKKKKSVKDKITRESYNKQKAIEIYDPFGKGGCGAPVRDQFGNLVADLKQMRKINENRLSNTSPLSQPQSKEKEGLESPLAGNSPRTTILTYNKDNEDAKQAVQNNYRDYLQRQVKEKEEIKRKEKERLKLEEEKELEQLEKDRKRLKEEYQQELGRQRRKGEEALRKNEEIKREAERKRQITIMQQEQRDEVADERWLDTIANSSFRPAQSRAESPPIPTLRHKMKQFSEAPPRTPNNPEPSSFRSSSPPVPTLRKKQAKSKLHDAGGRADSAGQTVNEPVAGSHPPHAQPVPVPVTYPRPPEATTAYSDHQPHETSRGQNIASRLSPQRQRVSLDQNTLLTQLGAIRMHLQTELAKQTSQQHLHSDIFEKAKQQKPRIAAPKILRPKDSATVNALDDFTKLKNESSRRGDFHREFPEDPESVSMLEMQQQALLRHQHAKAQRGNVRQRPGRVEDMDSPMLSAHTSRVSRNPFADSASISGASLADSAHEPRRQWERVPSPGGRSKFSVNTLEVEDMAARNEERLQRLEAILNTGSAQRDRDDRSLNYSASVATRHPAPGGNIVSRQSELSLDCDTQHLPASFFMYS